MENKDEKYEPKVVPNMYCGACGYDRDRQKSEDYKCPRCDYYPDIRKVRQTAEKLGLTITGEAPKKFYRIYSRKEDVNLATGPAMKKLIFYTDLVAAYDAERHNCILDWSDSPFI